MFFALHVRPKTIRRQTHPLKYCIQAFHVFLGEIRKLFTQARAYEAEQAVVFGPMPFCSSKQIIGKSCVQICCFVCFFVFMHVHAYLHVCAFYFIEMS